MDATTRWDPWADVRETHSGTVVLMGEHAYKVKKPVDLGFLDFTERETRTAVCEREVELNRRLAPDVYLGVGGLVRPDGVTEPVVVMRRMPESARLSDLLRRGKDLTVEVDRIARVLARFHSGAVRGRLISESGTRAAIAARWEASFAQVRPHAGTLLPADLLDAVETHVHRFLAGRDDLFEARVRRGAVVDGHGDLTTDDIFCLPDGPRLLDCLEFDDRLRHVDQLDDVAFIAMGLEDAGAHALSQRLVETWATLVGDPAPPALVHHFIAYRAFVRAKVGCLRGAQLDRPASDRVTSYAEMALAHLRTAAVTLVLVGGPPGVGKSTLAGAVADDLGMVVIRSDRLRKEAAGLDPATSAAAPYRGGIYTPERTRETYDTMLHRAGLLLRRGESVVLDASWTECEDRTRAAELAEAVGADLVQLQCDLDPATAARRMRDRTDISDADEHVAELMRAARAPWPGGITVDMRRPPQECADQACARIRPGAVHRPMLRRRPRMEPG
jgi:aminoglycoside phosphotransferase family enzyme/predicted kinase